MSRQATKAVGNRYFEARMRAAKYNEKLLTRAGAIDFLACVAHDKFIMPQFPPYHGNCRCKDWHPQERGQ